MIVPSIFFSEVANGLWKYAAIETELTADHQAVAHRHPVYDLLYAVLARRTGAAVLTRDRRLADLLDQLGIALRGGPSR